MNEEQTILFDVDGTLLDVREKYWAAHCSLARELGEDPGTRAEFWALKRQRASLFQLLGGWSRSSIRSYGKCWPATVEDPRFTSLDHPFPMALDTLSKLKGVASLIAISMRRHSGPLLASLVACKLDRLLDGVILRDSHETAVLEKVDLLRASPYSALPFRWVVGDSDDDVALARSLDCRSLVVLSGLRDGPYLVSLEPDDVLNDITELPRLLANECNAQRPTIVL